MLPPAHPPWIFGLAVLLGAFAAWRQLQTSQRQLTLAEQGQITERFTRSVDQLGSDKLDIRLGGIYALARIARDSDTDRSAIASILMAFVRKRCPKPLTELEHEIDELPDLQRRAPDVQAALTILGREKFSDMSLDLDLGATDLRVADLQQADLQASILNDADLRRANLTKADLSGSILVNADFHRAILSEANLRDSHLNGADLRGAILWGADLRGATADPHTLWPDDFDPQSHDVLVVPDP